MSTVSRHVRRRAGGIDNTMQPIDVSSILVSAAIVAERFGVSAKTVHNWAAKGVIPKAIHVGNVIRFDLEEVEAALRKDK